MKNDGLRPNIIKIDGGMSQNEWFNQFLSDILNLKVSKSKIQETTALGAALIAGYGAGIFKSFSQLSKINRTNVQFTPKMNKKNRLKLLNGWNRAIRKTIK